MAQILRYPYEALTDETDYLQIDIVGYTPVGQLPGGSLVSGGPIRRISSIENTKGATPQTTRLKSGVGTILLPIPSNVQDGNSVSFADGNLDGLTAEVYSAVNTAMTKNNFSNIGSLFKAENYTDVIKGLAEPFIGNAGTFKKIFLAQLASSAANIPLGGSLTRDAVFARQSGEILNQNVELLFNGVNLRSFKFSFKLTPRSSDEAKQVKFIINAFKKNMAPKLGGKSGTTNQGEVSNIFLSTPNVFNLTYKKGNDPHPFLHKFKQCALTDMSVNYTGEGVYATYGGANKDGGGTPVSMVLELGFKELEPIYDADYNIDNDKDEQLTRGVGY